MVLSSFSNDLKLFLCGLGRFSSAVVDVQLKEAAKFYANSSLKSVTENSSSTAKIIINKSSKIDLQNFSSEVAGRITVVNEGFRDLLKHQKEFTPEDSKIRKNDQYDVNDKYSLLEHDIVKDSVNGEGRLLADLDIPSIVPGSSSISKIIDNSSELRRELESNAKKFENFSTSTENIGWLEDGQNEAIQKKLNEIYSLEANAEIKNIIQMPKESVRHGSDNETVNIRGENSSDATGCLKNMENDNEVENILKSEAKSASLDVNVAPTLIGRKPLAKSKAKSTLSDTATARKVPHSRIGRMMTFGGLAASLSVGTLAELTRRKFGIDKKGKNSVMDASPFLTDANARRIVDTLCKVRGAALKLGQMISIQDDAFLNPQLQKIFERVRQSADFMPTWQLERTLIGDFGPNWRSMVTSFDEKPFAAASIGQVHQAMTLDGRSVAMKIQYPGVADGIESDINNLISTLNVAKILPEGLFVDSIVEVAKKELGWECDYEREKEYTKKFAEIVNKYPDYYVPEVIDELSSKRVLTTELIEGIPVDKCSNLDQERRNYICKLIVKLSLLELFSFGYMQTDPNWSNFFYNEETRQLALLDFGACREYKKSFVDDYIEIIHGAAYKDREKILKYSRKLGFLTGYEAQIMEDAHVDSVFVLGEAFQKDEPFHFGEQDTTHKLHGLIPVMVKHRMCPPPEESYSLHRKMSGIFLLSAKLKGVVNCKPIFDQIYANYQTGGTWEDVRHIKFVD